MSILGSTLFEASIKLDSLDNGMVVERPAERFVSLYDAQSWIKQELQTAEVDGYWYASIVQNRVIDPVGSGNSWDFELQPTAISNELFETT